MSNEATHLLPSKTNPKSVNSRAASSSFRPPPPRQPSSEPYSEDMQSDASTALTTVDIDELMVMLERAQQIVSAHSSMVGEDGKVPVPLSSNNNHRPRPLIPLWLTQNLLLITFVLQATNVGILELIGVFENTTTTNNSTDKSPGLVAGNAIMTVIEAAHLLLVIFVTFKLVKQVIHRTASGSLLAQSFLSTVLLFAGIYVMEYRFMNDAWKYISFDSHSNAGTVILFLKFLYFSVSTATLCGTSEVEPAAWFTDITVSLQMLLSFVYFPSILSMATLPRKRSRYDPPPSVPWSFTRFARQRFRRCCC